MKRAITIALMLAAIQAAAVDVFLPAPTGWTWRVEGVNVLASYATNGAPAAPWYESESWYPYSLAYWQFNDAAETNITDYSAVGTNLAYLFKSDANATNYSFASSAFRPDVGTSGTTPYAIIKSSATSLLDGATNWTVAAWVYADSFPALSAILYRFGATSDGLRCATNAVSGFNNNVVITKGGAMPTNTWAHVAFTCSGSAVGARRLYINGVQVASNTATSATTMGTNGAWALGMDMRSTTDRQWIGMLDDALLVAYPMSGPDLTNMVNHGRTE